MPFVPLPFVGFLYVLNVQSYLRCTYYIHTTLFADVCESSAACPYDYVSSPLGSGHFCSPVLDNASPRAFPSRRGKLRIGGSTYSKYCVQDAEYDKDATAMLLDDGGSGTTFISPYCCAAFQFVYAMQSGGTPDRYLSRTDALWTIPGWMESAHLCGNVPPMDTSVSDAQLSLRDAKPVLPSLGKRGLGYELPYRFGSADRPSLCFKISGSEHGVVKVDKCVLPSKPQLTRRVEKGIFDSVFGSIDKIVGLLQHLVDPIVCFIVDSILGIAKRLFAIVIHPLFHALPQGLLDLLLVVAESLVVFGIAQMFFPKFGSLLVAGAVLLVKLISDPKYRQSVSESDVL